MRQVLIDYLSSNDRKELAYKVAESQINKLNPHRPSNSQELLDLLESLNSISDSLMITILSHGHNRGITFGTYNTVNSINKGLLAIENNSFNDFIAQLDDSEIELYKEIV